MNKNTIKHRELIELLNDKYDYNLKIQTMEYFGEELNIDTNDINKAIVVFCDLLNINSGSTGRRDLYKLLQNYLTDSKVQDSINEII